ncbi:SH3 and cysteine-rich domain-containing protein 2-like isoform X2 [Electrophorus electricus]|uniref:SH3 and cysteine-rich domain-containing protein 2-like isoform X2 n=1 Tax=Electrophorus electricus TaxID=8005 RepID=UPI0015CFD508|nr:SH3 and cysteine-rich domain-containing protein 2-like isoform X2 [Electrophorus electricus]
MTENEMNSELQRSPGTSSVTAASKLLRLKRSFAFMRSKSVENFFQRSYSDARLPSDFISDPPPPSPPMLPGSPLPSDNSAILSPSVSPKPSLSPSPVVQQPRPMQTHCFLEHVFRRPSSCQLCKHVIVGNSKQGLRCKTCKIAAHLWCTSELSQQTCYGKTGMFKRNYSSPLLVIDQLGPVRESQPAQEAKTRIDPVYATLRYGTSLAQMSRSSFGSMSESPTHSLGGEKEDGEMEAENKPDEDPEIADLPPSEDTKTDTEETVKIPKLHTIHTYVALYRFLPQESNDLQLHPGDRVQVTDDSNEEWWKGKSGNKVGFFPANFVQRVRPGESVWRVTQGAQGNRQLGHMAVKEDQICVGKKDNSEGFLKLHSGKKRGLVPAHSLEEI